jgi:hypothetical protein
MKRNDRNNIFTNFFYYSNISSSLLPKSIIYGQKSFIALGPDCILEHYKKVKSRQRLKMAFLTKKIVRFIFLELPPVGLDLYYIDKYNRKLHRRKFYYVGPIKEKLFCQLQLLYL